MFLHGPSQATLLWTILFLQDVLGFCERPPWASVFWDMTPGDLKQLTKEQANCLHDSTCQICSSFSGMTLSKGCLEILYASCKVALLLVACLVLHYFLLKLKRKKDTKCPQKAIPVTHTEVVVATETHEEYTRNTDKMLFRLVTNTSKMMKYMKHMARRHKKEKYRNSNKKRKADEIDDDDEQFFPVCPHNHSSSGDTIMHEI